MEKKSGGSVAKVMSGKPRFIVETQEMDAQFAVQKDILLYLNMHLYIILRRTV